MIERTILENLIRNEQYVRKVLPFIKKEYYTDRHERVLFEEISKFVQRYNNLPTQTSLEIELQNRKDLNGEDYGKIVAILKNFTNDSSSNTNSADFDWLVDTTEKFCKDKAIYNAIVEGINIIDVL